MSGRRQRRGANEVDVYWLLFPLHAITLRAFPVARYPPGVRVQLHAIALAACPLARYRMQRVVLSPRASRGAGPRSHVASYSVILADAFPPDCLDCMHFNLELPRALACSQLLA